MFNKIDRGAFYLSVESARVPTERAVGAPLGNLSAKCGSGSHFRRAHAGATLCGHRLTQAARVPRAAPVGARLERRRAPAGQPVRPGSTAKGDQHFDQSVNHRIQRHGQ